jgi:hypothetical protein
LGRFVQRDPIGFAAGDNNMYRFVGNGPTGAVDPSGLAEGYNSINEWLTGPVPQLSQADIEQIEQLERMLRARPSQPSPTGFVPWQGRDGAVSCIGRMHRASGHSPDGHPISGSAALDAVQAGLDLFGLVPGAGEVFDGLNGLISLGRGDYTGAGLSFAAMWPVGGQAATAAKFGLKYGDEVAAAGRCAAPRTRVSGHNPPISPRQRLHVNGPAGKSQFNAGVDVEGVVRTAWEGGTPVFNKNGQFIGKRYTFSKPVGTSPTGHPQNSVFVHWSPNSGIHGVPTTVGP